MVGLGAPKPRDGFFQLILAQNWWEMIVWNYPLVNFHITIENHHFQWENPLFLWPFSIAMLNYQRVSFQWSSWSSKVLNPEDLSNENDQRRTWKTICRGCFLFNNVLLLHVFFPILVCLVLHACHPHLCFIWVRQSVDSSVLPGICQYLMRETMNFRGKLWKAPSRSEKNQDFPSNHIYIYNIL